MDEAKPFKIPKREIWEAFKRVKANQGAAGVDGQSIAAFEANLSGNLYKLWNRLSSGSYFPPPVRRVDIPKTGGAIFSRDQRGGGPEAWPSGIRHVGGAKPDQALVWNVRTCRPDAKGDVQAAKTARTRVPMRGTGAESSVVGLKVL